MARWNVGPKNGLWRGGRVLASNGYILVRVGRGHPLADVRGYAYEHRIVAEKKIGRSLKRGEVIHHLDGNKTNNDPGNVEVMPSRAHHKHEHGTRKDLKHPDEDNRQITCSCGCGTSILKYDYQGRPRRFVSGHNLRSRSS